jgi:peptidoglycan/xylan/chitin deacetylase (PgdA/CDA1 family)
MIRLLKMSIEKLRHNLPMKRLLILLFLCMNVAVARAPVYVVLWFDTEDYIDPIADDAALRIAQDLDRLGVRATFKVVGEKARTLEARGRRDVIRALSLHDIGYHAENHSIAPAPSVHLRS